MQEFGYLLACFKAIDNQYCLLQKMSPISSENEFDCPMYVLSFDLVVVQSSCVCSPVSFVHECQHTCTFTEQLVSVAVERDSCSTCKLTFVHDYTNRQFCYNIYCTN